MIQIKNLIYVLALIAGIIILWKFCLEETVKYSFNSIEEINEESESTLEKFDVGGNNSKAGEVDDTIDTLQAEDPWIQSCIL